MSDGPVWEKVTTGTMRLLVPGGWLYRCCWGENDAVVFVPDPRPRVHTGDGTVRYFGEVPL